MGTRRYGFLTSQDEMSVRFCDACQGGGAYGKTATLLGRGAFCKPVKVCREACWKRSLTLNLTNHFP
ncbi:hypothetical protein FG621_023715 [Salmonella enterica subsp. enterica serovar Anatum]|nr:hypothetical protein FG621_023715 [Salmonella enterica subsp. enterica serovar Anatum]